MKRLYTAALIATAIFAWILLIDSAIELHHRFAAALAAIV